MTDFIIYILKSSIVLGILYVLYLGLFRKETFFHLNRVFILAALVISMLAPALDIALSQPSSTTWNNFDSVENAFLGFSETMDVVELKTAENVTSFPIMVYLLVLGMLLAASRVGFQLFHIYKNIRKYDIKNQGRYNYVLIDQYYSTHSFFNYIFVQKSEFQKRRMKEVLLHEQMHANQLHSIDLLLIGFLSILQWFNPFIYFFKRALVETHEFQADQAVIRLGIDKCHYQQLLLEQARSIVITGLTSSFNQSIIKNRLKMMNKIKSSNKAIIKYIMVVPVVFVLSSFFGVSQDKIEESISEAIAMSSVTVAQDTTKESNIDLILVEENGLTGTFPNFMIIKLSENERLEFESDELSSMEDGDLYLKGEVKILLPDNNLKVSAENAVYKETERKWIIFTNESVPSLIPVKMKDATITSGFGMRIHPILKQEMMHNGVDFSAPAGTPIMTSANGTVRSVEFIEKKYGNRVIVDHGNGYSTSYSQMQNYIVKTGQSVKKGEVIGYVGSSGLSTAPHLHYEVMKDGKFVDPADYFEQQVK